MDDEKIQDVERVGVSLFLLNFPALDFALLPLFPNPQQLFHLLLPFFCQLFVPAGVEQGEAVAAFFQPVHRFLSGGVQALFQGVLGQGRDDDHGNEFPVAGLYDLFHVDVEEVAVGFPAEVIEDQQVVAADIV